MCGLRYIKISMRPLIAVALLTLLGGFHARAEEQVIALNAGWNLISMQVGNIWDMQDIEANLDVEDALLAVWGYDAISASWSCYQPTLSDFSQTLAYIEPGKGYWVKVSEDCLLTLAGAPWDGEVTLEAGWNLVGLPGLNEADSEPQALTSVFQDRFDLVQQVWTFDSGWAQQFIGYDTTAIPKRADLTTISAGIGYWIFATEQITLSTVPVITLIGDADFPPLQEKVAYDGPPNPLYDGKLVRKSGEEDTANGTDLNGNGILDDPWTQDAIRFDIGVDRRMVVIQNDGLGLMNWSIEENVPWLSIDKTSGVVGSEKAYATLRTDLTGMEPGTYTGASIVIHAGTLSKTVHLILEVPGIAGDYHGSATTTRVNGKDISLGKVDLALNLFTDTDNENETLFSAVINRDRSLLFPQDVFMNGVFYKGNDFSLTTSFSMPEGDRNVPPYDTFSETDGDLDVNGDGVLDVNNPFPFPIRREVTLLGSRVDPDKLEGTYVEAIRNVLPNNKAIFIEGTFSLERETYEPSRRSIYNQADDTLTQIGGSISQPIVKTITVNDAVVVQNVQIALDIDFPSPELLTISLVSPEGTTVMLHRNGTVLASLYELSDFNNKNGQGDWTLRIGWDTSTGERGLLNSWNLDIEGLAFYSATARIVDVKDGVTNGLPGAEVILSGSNQIKYDQSGDDGIIQFDKLMQNEYQLSISRIGYQSVQRSFFIDDRNEDLGDIVLSPITVSEPQIITQPTVGAGPLQTYMEVQVPLELLESDIGGIYRVYWYFSDGTTNITTTVGTTHTFTSPGYYNVMVVIAGYNGGVVVTGPSVTVNALAPDPSLYPEGLTNFITGCAFLGAGSAIDLPDGSVLYKENQRDMAAFDIDRWPTNNYLGAEDSDFFVQENTPYYNESQEPPDGNYDVYQQPDVGPDRYRLICTMGGYVMGTEPASVGEFMLQAGRIEE